MIKPTLGCINWVRFLLTIAILVPIVVISTYFFGIIIFWATLIIAIVTIIMLCCVEKLNYIEDHIKEHLSIVWGFWCLLIVVMITVNGLSWAVILLLWMGLWIVLIIGGVAAYFGIDIASEKICEWKHHGR
jgi:hypothetical protein